MCGVGGVRGGGGVRRMRGRPHGGRRHTTQHSTPPPSPPLLVCECSPSALPRSTCCRGRRSCAGGGGGGGRGRNKGREMRARRRGRWTAESQLEPSLSGCLSLLLSLSPSHRSLSANLKGQQLNGGCRGGPWPGSASTAFQLRRCWAAGLSRHTSPSGAHAVSSPRSRHAALLPVFVPPSRYRVDKLWRKLMQRAVSRAERQKPRACRPRRRWAAHADEGGVALWAIVGSWHVLAASPLCVW